MGVDLILDAVGKTTFPGDLKAAKTRGNIVIDGAASGQADPVSGAGLGLFIATRADLLRRADDIIAGVHAGWPKLAIERLFSLEETPEAHRLLESRATSGKLPITL